MTKTVIETDSAGVEAALRAYAPMRVQPPLLPESDLAYLVVDDLPVGRMLLAVRPGGALVASAYVPDDARVDAVTERLARVVSPRVLRQVRPLDEVRRQLEDYLAGRRHGFDLDVDTVLATPFQRMVLGRLAGEVGFGHTVSYGGLASSVGRPRAARAVGAALGANPLCIVLPCHRVVAADGALTGYAGGLAAKRLLLTLESFATSGV